MDCLVCLQPIPDGARVCHWCGAEWRMTGKGRKWAKASDITQRKMRVAIAEGIILATVLLTVAGFFLSMVLFSTTYRSTPSRYNTCPVTDSRWPDC